MKGSFCNIRIKGIKTVIPKTQLDNMAFSDILGERRCKKQIKLTGVKSRYVSNSNQTSTDLSYLAGKTLIEEIGWNPEDISVLILATQNPLFVLPSTAFYLQKLLKIPKNCMAFDINLGCTGAVTGIEIVSSLLQHLGVGGKGLLLVSDAVYGPSAYEMQDPDMLAHQMLFGSAGSAVALEVVAPDSEIMDFASYSDGNRYQAILRKPGCSFQMNGEAVFEFGVNDVCNSLKEFKQYFDIKNSDVDFYVFHQAQSLMLNTIDAECSIDSAQDLRSLECFGNTNGSSVLVSLCANKGKYITESNRCILCGFGVGLSWSYLYLTIPTYCILPITYSDYHIEEI